jgi:hypothetical protein
MTKLNSLARARVIDPEGGAEDGAADAGVEEGVVGVDVLVVSSSRLPCFFSRKQWGWNAPTQTFHLKSQQARVQEVEMPELHRGGGC